MVFLVNISYDFSSSEGSSIWNSMKEKLQDQPYGFVMNCKYGDFPTTTALKQISASSSIEAIRKARNAFVKCFNSVTHSDVDEFTMLISCDDRAFYYTWFGGSEVNEYIIF